MALDIRRNNRQDKHADKRLKAQTKMQENEVKAQRNPTENPEQPAEEKKTYKGQLRLQTFEAPQPAPFMTAKADDPQKKSE